MNEISDAVKAVIADQLGLDVAGVEEDMDFVEDLGMDSLDGIELVIAIEDALSIEIPDDECDRITTVFDLIAQAERKMRGRRRSEHPRDTAGIQATISLGASL